MKRLLSILIFSMFVSIQAINIQLLKGTHAVPGVPSDYAPFWGLTFIECDIAQQWYRLSPKIMNKEIEDRLKTIQNPNNESVLKLLKNQTNSATQNLVANMFHITGGTFNVTAAPNNPVVQLKPEHIGHLLRMVHDQQQATKKDDSKFQENLEKYLASLGFKKQSGSNFIAKDFRPFVTALLGALAESDPTSANQMYAKNTAQGLLLGYMLAKSNDKTDLQNYFKGFLGNDAFVLPEDTYSADEFKKIAASDEPDLNNVDQVGDYVCTTIYQKKYASGLPKIVDNKIVAYQGIRFPDCVETTMRNLANIATYDTSTSKLGIAPKGVTMNAALQKFYQVEKNASVSDVGHQNVHQAWVDLVENQVGVSYNRLLDPASKQVLTMNVLYNGLPASSCDGVIPVDNVKAGLPIKEVQIGNNKYQLYEKKIDDQTFWLVPKNSGLVCYEIMPSAANIITTMNRLFNLNLYTSEDEVLTEGFASKYFKNMCEKLGWEVADDVIEKMKTSRSLEFQIKVINTQKVFTVHLSDKAHGNVSIKEKQNQSTNQLYISQIFQADQAVQAALVSLNKVPNKDVIKHSTLLSRNIPVLNKDQRFELIRDLMPVVTEDNAPYLAQLLYSFSTEQDMHYIDTISSLLWVHDNACKIPFVYDAFSAIAVCSQSSQAQAVYAYIGTKNNLSPKSSDSIDDVHAKALLDCIEKAIKLHYLKVGSAKALEVMTLIDKGLQSTNSDTQKNSWNVAELLIDAWFANSENLPQILEWIDKRIQSPDFIKPIGSVNVFPSLSIQGVINSENISQILKWIEKWMHSTNPQVQENSLNLVPLLITTKLIKSENLPQVLRWIDKGMQSTNPQVQDKSLDVINLLVRDNLINFENVPQVLVWIEKGMQSTNPQVQKNSLGLVHSLVYKEFINSEGTSLVYKRFINSENVPQILKWIDKGMQSTDSQLQYKSVYLIESLVNNWLIDSENLPQFTALIDKGMQSTSYKVSSLASKLQKKIDSIKIAKSVETKPAELPKLK